MWFSLFLLQAGEEIVVATTDFESFHTETLFIESVSEGGKVITLAKPVQHRHIGELNLQFEILQQSTSDLLFHHLLRSLNHQ